MNRWAEAFRLKFLPQGVLPVFLGTVVAFNQGYPIRMGYFILALFGMTLVQFGLTMLNDLVDYSKGTDKLYGNEKNPYSGGSGVLAEGKIAPREMLAVIAAFYAIAFFIGVYFAFRTGITVLYIALIGFFISISYSMEPFKFAYRGVGEFMMLLGYGPTITLGAYFVQSKALAWKPFLAGLVPGMLMWAMILVNEIPDYEEDFSAGKKNLTVRLGREKSAKLYVLSLAAVYLFILTCILAGIFPLNTAIALLSLPFALKSIDCLRKYYLDKIKVEAANKEMVKIYSFTMVLLTIGFII